MSRLDHLPADQKAALSLLLRRRESYAGLAGMLKISERAVHDRAHAALAMLAPAQARALSAEEREVIGEFLLGQQRIERERAQTLQLLESSPAARAWAHALTAELEPIGDGSLPRVPATAEAPVREPDVPPTPERAPASAPSGAAPAATDAAPETAAATSARASSRQALPVSRTAGAILLAVLIAGVVLAAVLIPSGGGSSKPSGAPASRGEASSTNAAKPAVNKRITLSAAESGSHAVGVALVLSEGGRYAFYLAAERMPPSKGFFYAVWLYNSPTSAEALGKSPAVGSNGRLQGGALLPADAGKYSRMVVTRETNEHPTRPGPIVLSGPFGLR
jgi:hypothetical protein